MEFGNRLKKIRQEKGYSLSKAARLLGISQSTYRDWERGRAIKGEPYPKLADFYNITLAELFGITESKNDISVELQLMEESIRRIRMRI